MASTGVAPMPALISSTGALVWSRMNVPRGAATSSWSPTREPRVQVAAGGAVGLALDGDPVVAGAGRSREGVVAQQRPLVGVGPDPHREVLARAGGGERRAVGILEADGDRPSRSRA